MPRVLLIGLPGGAIVGLIGQSETVSYGASFLIWSGIFSVAAFMWLRRHAY